MGVDYEHNIYRTVDSLDLTPFEKYKYLTENDSCIVELKEKVRAVVEKKNLSSVMNDTKWLKLQQGIEKLPFPPVYNEKLILGDNPKFSFNDFETEPAYFGNWSSYWEEGFPIFFTVEWIEIRPRFSKHQGRLVSPKIEDETEELIKLLIDLQIPYEQNGDSVFVYGYK